MKEIILTRGLACIVDDGDYEWLSQFKWHATREGYASRGIQHPQDPGKWSRISMHRTIVGLGHGDPRAVDHINRNRLDNRRSNLRICIQAENNRNTSLRKDNASGRKGVSLHKSGKWQANIQVNGNFKYLGLFDNIDDAYQSYCDAAEKLHGTFACLGSEAS
jgi:hypothetical protein